jgi:hypothetical protein
MPKEKKKKKVKDDISLEENLQIISIKSNCQAAVCYSISDLAQCFVCSSSIAKTNGCKRP